MSVTLRAANAHEIDDLIFWLDDHPDDADLSIRHAAARWLMELSRTTETFPIVTVVPEGIEEVLDALIEDWIEVMSAHHEEFFSELGKASH